MHVQRVSFMNRPNLLPTSNRTTLNLVLVTSAISPIPTHTNFKHSSNQHLKSTLQTKIYNNNSTNNSNKQFKHKIHPTVQTKMHPKFKPTMKTNSSDQNSNQHFKPKFKQFKQTNNSHKQFKPKLKHIFFYQHQTGQHWILFLRHQQFPQFQQQTNFNINRTTLNLVLLTLIIDIKIKCSALITIIGDWVDINIIQQFKQTIQPKN